MILFTFETCGKEPLADVIVDKFSWCLQDYF